MQCGALQSTGAVDCGDESVTFLGIDSFKVESYEQLSCSRIIAITRVLSAAQEFRMESNKSLEKGFGVVTEADCPCED